VGQPGGFEGRLEALDVALFEEIPSQTTENDRRSLLALQLALRSLVSPYRYLEIGSYVGGSIQTHLLDPNCAEIYSIDARPGSQPDNSGLRLRYPNNTTERMMENLRGIADPEKVRCLAGDTGAIDPARIEEPGADLCFIDGEHRDEVVVRDFEFCRSAGRGRVVVVFHDAQLVYEGISRALSNLREAGIPFHAYNLPSTLLVVELGELPIHRHPAIAPMLIDNHVGYLESLHANDHFRRWATTGPVRVMRAVKSRLSRTDVSP
jgi:methyltransferase family protein